ncbi:MAG TPA: response regulator transcription factor [Chryseosolibacter sp.]|nr:response regulator transcription factor [Chryseosolibacter sp.]
MTPLVLLEDDEKIRNYLSALVVGSQQFHLEAAFESAEDAIQYFETGAADTVRLVLTDIELPGKTGIDFISWVKPLYPHLQIMVLSAYDDADRVFRAIKAGASGYVLKNTPASKLVEALHDLKNGGSPMSSQIARMVVTAFQAVPPPGSVVEALSLREKDVLHWLSQGFRYQEIADKLFISIETVRTHVRNIYEKLHARNRAEALRNAGLK